MAQIKKIQLTSKIQRAIIRAAVLHDGQKRKGDGLPYIIHPYSVAFILNNYVDDEEIIISGLLHDTLEDVSDYRENDLKKEFGEKVLKIVKEVSEEKTADYSKKKKKATWQIRKEKYLSHLKKASFEAMMVCAADKIDNLQSIMKAYQEKGDKLWEKFNAPKDKKLWFYGKVLKILKERLDNVIVQDLEKTYLEAESMLNSKVKTKTKLPKPNG